MKKKKTKKFRVDVLMTGPGGDLYFKPVEASKDDISKLLETTKDSVIKYNLKKEMKAKPKKGKKGKK